MWIQWLLLVTVRCFGCFRFLGCSFGSGAMTHGLRVFPNALGPHKMVVHWIHGIRWLLNEPKDGSEGTPSTDVRCVEILQERQWKERHRSELVKICRSQLWAWGLQCSMKKPAQTSQMFAFCLSLRMSTELQDAWATLLKHYFGIFWLKMFSCCPLDSWNFKSVVTYFDNSCCSKSAPNPTSRAAPCVRFGSLTRHFWSPMAMKLNKNGQVYARSCTVLILLVMLSLSHLISIYVITIILAAAFKIRSRSQGFKVCAASEGGHAQPNGKCWSGGRWSQGWREEVHQLWK